MCRGKSKAVQTGLDVGLQYWWPHHSPDAVASAQYGLAFVDPASVATTVVSADALEGISLPVYVFYTVLPAACYYYRQLG